MAIVKTLTTDEIPDAFLKVNDAMDAQVVGAEMAANGVLNLNTFGGGVLPVAVPFAEDRIIEGLTLTSLAALDWQLEPGIYQVNGFAVEVAAAVPFTLAGRDATKRRIDAIIADEIGSINLVSGTFSGDLPVKPLAGAGEIVLAYIQLPSALDGSDSTIYKPSNNWDVYEGESIGAAILAASPGDTVTIWPGIYEEQIALRDRVNIVLKSGATILRSSAGPAITDSTLAGSKSVLIHFEGGANVRAVGLASYCLEASVAGASITIFNPYFHADAGDSQAEALIHQDGTGNRVTIFGGNIINFAAGFAVHLESGEFRANGTAILAAALNTIKKAGGDMFLQNCKVVTYNPGTAHSIETDGSAQNVHIYSVFANYASDANITELISPVVVDLLVSL